VGGTQPELDIGMYEKHSPIVPLSHDELPRKENLQEGGLSVELTEAVISQKKIARTGF
jgi:hypothetical protein